MTMTIDEALEKLRDPTVTELDLSDCGFGEVEAKQIADALPHSQITLLYLDYNHIGDTGAAALAGALPHSRVIELSLHRNNIADAGAAAMVDALPHSQVTELSLGNNTIGDAETAICETKTQENVVLAQALAQKLVGETKLEQPDRIALQRLTTAVTSYLGEEHKLNKATIKSLLLGAAEQFLADGAPQTKAFVLRVLPLPEAREWLEEKDLPLSLQDDFLAPEGRIPQGRFLCQGGLRALFLEEELWETKGQFSKAFRNLPPEQKVFVSNAHTLSANLSKRVVVSAGPEVG